MKNTLFVIIGLLVSTSASAKDSVRLLCDDGTVAIHVSEPLAVGGRATEATMIYGQYSLSGLIDESGSVFLAEKYTDTFSGTMLVDYERLEVTAEGYLSLSGAGSQLSFTLPCKEMNGDL